MSNSHGSVCTVANLSHAGVTALRIAFMEPKLSSRIPGEASEFEPRLAPIRTLLAEGKHRAALTACEQLRSTGFDEPALLRLQGRAAEALGDYDEALALARIAVKKRPRNVRARLRLARCLWRMGEPGEALGEVNAVAATAQGRAGALLRVGAFYAEVGRHEPAYHCRLRALELRPEDPLALAAVAESAAALGRVQTAERHYDRALYHDPSQFTLLERRSRLRPRSEDDQMAPQLGYALDALERDDPRRAPLAFALARQLEDLGHFEPAFGIWSEGARCRLLALQEAPGDEREALETVRGVFDERWLESCAAGEAGDGFVFLTGLPGSGLDRVAALLSSSPDATVMRNPGFLADAVTRLAGVTGSRRERLRRAADVAPATLATAYEHATSQVAGASSRFVDVAEVHVWLLGVLRAALPAARIVHLRRNPLDHCLDLYTTLFPKGHAWSYELRELARYYASYHQLMGHWRRNLPGGFLDLDYEELVNEPEVVAGRLGAFLELSLDRAVAVANLDAGRGAGVGRAACYERELEPLAQRLRDDGVPVH